VRKRGEKERGRSQGIVRKSEEKRKEGKRI
jgi:hypothetical protein